MSLIEAAPIDTGVIRLVIGFAVSLLLGWLFTALFYRWTTNKITNGDEELEREMEWDQNTKGVPREITGLLERFFFTIVVIINVPAAPFAMLVWLTLKMATNWNRDPLEGVLTKQQARRRARFSLRSLLSGLVSMSFALIGGLIAAGSIPFPPP